MLAALLYHLWPYQIFKSVLFRGGMTFLTSYLIIIFWMPRLICWFRAQGITSDFKTVSVQTHGRPYTAATPIMGGLILVASIFIATLLWSQLNQYILALLFILVAFAAIGAWDDLAKVRHKRRVEKGEESQKNIPIKPMVSAEKRDFSRICRRFFCGVDPLSLCGNRWSFGGTLPPLKNLVPLSPLLFFYSLHGVYHCGWSQCGKLNRWSRLVGHSSLDDLYLICCRSRLYYRRQ